MIVRDASNFVEITPLERIPAHLPTPGDTRFSIRIQSERFSGEGTTWIDLPALKKFANELAELDSKRSGRAEIRGISPEEFNLVIETIDRWGHPAISGRLAHAKQAIEFGFEFSAEFLVGVVSEFREFASSIT